MPLGSFYSRKCTLDCRSSQETQHGSPDSSRDAAQDQLLNQAVPDILGGTQQQQPRIVTWGNEGDTMRLFAYTLLAWHPHPGF